MATARPTRPPSAATTTTAPTALMKRPTTGAAKRPSALRDAKIDAISGQAEVFTKLKDTALRVLSEKLSAELGHVRQTAVKTKIDETKHSLPELQQIIAENMLALCHKFPTTDRMVAPLLEAYRAAVQLQIKTSKIAAESKGLMSAHEALTAEAKVLTERLEETTQLKEANTAMIARIQSESEAVAKKLTDAEKQLEALPEMHLKLREANLLAREQRIRAAEWEKQLAAQAAQISKLTDNLLEEGSTRRTAESQLAKLREDLHKQAADKQLVQLVAGPTPRRNSAPTISPSRGDITGSTPGTRTLPVPVTVTHASVNFLQSTRGISMTASRPTAPPAAAAAAAAPGSQEYYKMYAKCLSAFFRDMLIEINAQIAAAQSDTNRVDKIQRLQDFRCDFLASYVDITKSDMTTPKLVAELISSKFADLEFKTAPSPESRLILLRSKFDGKSDPALFAIIASFFQQLYAHNYFPGEKERASKFRELSNNLTRLASAPPVVTARPAALTASA